MITIDIIIFSFTSSSIINSSNLSGYFLNEKNDKKKTKNTFNEEKKDSNSDDNDNFDVSCILVGVTGPLLQRLYSLQVEVFIMTDKETLKSYDFSKMNLDKQNQGRTGISIITVQLPNNFHYYCKY